MKRTGIFVLAVVFLAGCAKEEEDALVDVAINFDGFSVSADDFNSLKSTSTDMFYDFSHVFAGGILYFENEDGYVTEYSSGDFSLNGAYVSLAPGKYKVYGQSHEEASPEGSDEMQYMIHSQEVYITSSTAMLDLTVEPTCALAIVSDASAMLSEAYITDYSMNEMWDLHMSGVYYYTYLLPYEGYSLNLVKYDHSEFSLETKDLSYGYVYKIEVQEQSEPMVNLYPYFQDGDYIVW